MTVSTTTNKVAYIGNGIAIEFAVPFPFLEKSHLKVYQLLNDIQTERTDWIIKSGNLIFKKAPVAGAEILILREVPLTQETDYRENAILPAETLERCFDKLTMQVQQLKEKTDRAVTVDMFDDTNASELLPNIKRSVSTAAEYANAAAEKVSEAAAHAQNAATSATSANEQAALAANKAQEASDLLVNKADKDLSNCTRPYVTETYRNGMEWYRVWSNGFKECGGITQCGDNTNYATFNFPIVFIDIPQVFTGMYEKIVPQVIYTTNSIPSVSCVDVVCGSWENSGVVSSANAKKTKISVYAFGF